MPYDWAKFVPITVLALMPNVITARNDLPANSAQELIAYAKANPGKVTYASQGNGSTSHLSAQMLATHGRHRDGACALQGRRARRWSTSPPAGSTSSSATSPPRCASRRPGR